MKKILIVDDSEVNLYLIKAIFENDPDIEVKTVSNSNNVLTLMREDIIDLLILDLMMPEIDGFQLLESLKKDINLCQLPVIIVSARSDENAFNQAKAYGVKYYLTKPINLQEIESKVKNVLYESKNRV